MYVRERNKAIDEFVWNGGLLAPSPYFRDIPAVPSGVGGARIGHAAGVGGYSFSLHFPLFCFACRNF